MVGATLTDLADTQPTLGGVPFPFSDRPTVLRSSHDVDGWLGGVQVGGMKQFGSWVVGAEISLSGANIDGSSGNCLGLNNSAAFGPGSSVTCHTHVNWMLTALSRLGFAADRWLVYGTAGWAVAGVDHQVTYNFAGFVQPNGRNEVADGFAWGAGIDFAIAKSLTLGVQYLHANLDARGEGITNFASGRRDIDLDTVTVRLNYKFGGD